MVTKKQPEAMTRSEKRIKVEGLKKKISALDHDIKITKFQSDRTIKKLKGDRKPLVNEKVKLTRKKRA